MKTIVTGATGFIGRGLVQHLLQAPGCDEVVALARDPQAARAVLPAACRVAAWNGRDPIGAEVLTGVRAIVHLAGEPVAGGRWTPERKRAILESRAAGTRALVASLAALSRSARPEVLVSASAVGFYGDRGDDVLDETSRGGSGFLADVCRAWETAALDAAPLGLRTAVVRIGVVLGTQGGALAQMLPLFRLGLGGRLGSGEQWMSWIHHADVVRLLAHAIVDGRAAGPLNAVAPHPVRNREFTQVLAAALHRPAVFPVPAFALRLAVGEMASMLLGGQRVAPARALDLGFRFAHPTLDAALADLLLEAQAAKPPALANAA